jgi:uncharacterized membrane protein (DUF2068 family)
MDAMVLLEGDAMVRVYHEFKRIFEEEDRGLSLLEFISAFINNVDFLHMEKKAIIKMLVDLFRHIDVNGDEVRVIRHVHSCHAAACIYLGAGAGVDRVYVILCRGWSGLWAVKYSTTHILLATGRAF